MGDTRIFLDPESSGEFSLKGEFLAFGERCEKVFEDFEAGKTLIVLNNRERAVNGCSKAAFYSNGRLMFSGGIKEVFRRYITYLDLKKKNKELAAKNKSVLKKMKEEKSDVMIKDFKLLDKYSREKYVFSPGEPLKVLIKFACTDGMVNQFRLMFFSKDNIFGTQEKVLDLLKKVKNNNEVCFEMNSLPLQDGNYLLSVSCLGKKRINYKGQFEIFVEKQKF